MMEKPVITKECVKPLLETPFLNVADLQYAEGRHYYDATRHKLGEITATLSDEEFKAMTADAVTMTVIVKTPDEEPKLLLFYEYRYPTGRFLLSPPAGLMDPEDKDSEDPIRQTAVRELFEETGIRFGEKDSLHVISPVLFSSPGMTDECNAFVCAVVNLPDLSSLTQTHGQGSECFDGFSLLSKDEAREILRNGRDPYGNFFSIYTWGALMYFVSGMWE